MNLTPLIPAKEQRVILSVDDDRSAAGGRKALAQSKKFSGEIHPGWRFLPKPFIGSQLRALVSGLVTTDKESRFVTRPAIA